MADSIDGVQQFMQDAVDDALQRRAARPVVDGRAVCANLDCQEPIAPARTALGAQLCMECALAEEARARHYGCGW